MKPAILVVSLLAVILFSVNAQDPVAEMKKVIEDCKQKHNCADDIRKIFKNNGQLSDECYCSLGCIGKATGSLNDKNGVVKEKLETMLQRGKHIPEDKIQAIAADCSSDSAADECEAMKTLMACAKSHLVPGS